MKKIHLATIFMSISSIIVPLSLNFGIDKNPNGVYQQFIAGENLLLTHKFNELNVDYDLSIKSKEHNLNKKRRIYWVEISSTNNEKSNLEGKDINVQRSSYNDDYHSVGWNWTPFNLKLTHNGEFYSSSEFVLSEISHFNVWSNSIASLSLDKGIKFQSDAFRFAPTFKFHTTMSEDQKPWFESHTTIYDKGYSANPFADPAPIFDQNGNILYYKHYFTDEHWDDEEDYKDYKIDSEFNHLESGYIDIHLNFRDPYIHNIHNRGVGKGEYFNFDNWLLDKSNKHRFTFHTQINFDMIIRKNDEPWKRRWNYWTIEDNLESDRSNWNDKNHTTDKVLQESGYRELVKKDGESPSITMHNAWYIPEGWHLSTKGENIYANYLIIEEDLNGDGIYQEHEKDLIFVNEGTSVLPLKEGQTEETRDWSIRTFNWGSKRENDPALPYIEGWNSLGTYSYFNVITPSIIAGIVTPIFMTPLFVLSFISFRKRSKNS